MKRRQFLKALGIAPVALGFLSFFSNEPGSDKWPEEVNPIFTPDRTPDTYFFKSGIATRIDMVNGGSLGVMTKEQYKLHMLLFTPRED